MNVPVRVPLNREDAAEEALARFRAQWPPERCERLAGLASGDPAAIAQVWVEALDRPSDTPADAAVRELLSDDQLKAHSKQHRKFARENRL